MPQYSAGRAALTVVPSLKGFKKQLKAELEAIQAELGVEMMLDDTGNFQAQLKEEIAKAEAAAGEVTLDANADTAEAEAQLEAAAEDKTATIEAEADTAKADAQLTAVARNRKAKVQVVLEGAGQVLTQIGALQGLGARLAAGARFAAVGTGIASIGVAAAGAIGPLSALIGVLASASGVVAAFPAAAAGAVAGLGTLLVGAKGVGGAFKEVGAAAAGGMADTGKAVQAAAKQVKQAELDLASAQRKTEQAQKDLNRARKDAAEQLKDMNDQLKDAALDEEDAALAVARAKQRLAEVNADPKASGLDRREADLAYRRAVKNLDDLRVKNNKLAQDVHEANQKGIEGSDGVLKAKEAVADAVDGERQAQERLADAVQALADAQSSAAAGSAGLAAAMSKLAPAAQDFVNQVKALGPAWEQVRLDTQQALFLGLGSAVTTLANVQLPVLRTGLAGIATEINGGVRAQLQALSAEAARSQLGVLLANTAAGLRNANVAAAPFAQTMMNLFAAGSNYLPQFGAWIAEISNRFSAFIDGAIADGRFDQWVVNAVNALKGIGATLANLGGIISGVFAAASAAGQSSLTPMGSLLAQLNQFVNSDAGQAALVGFFSAMQQAAAALMPVLGQVLSVFGSTLMPMLADFITAAAPGLLQMVQSIGNALTILQPQMPTLGAGVGALAAAFGSLLEKLAPVIAGLIEKLAPHLPAIVAGMAGLTIVGKVASFFGPLVNIIGKLWPLLSNVTKLLPLLRTGMSIATGPIGLVTLGITFLWQAFKYAYDHCEWFRKAVDEVTRRFKEGFARAIDNAKARIAKLAEKFSNAKQQVGEFIRDAIDKIKSLPDEITRLGSKLMDAGKNIVKSIWEGMKQAWRDVKDWFADKFSFGGRADTSTQANGGITHFAAGGFRYGGKLSEQQPGIVPGGSWVVMAEDETQGEAFIPFAPSKRKRSTQILKQTANHFGYDLVSRSGRATYYADGGITVDELDKFAQDLEGKPYVWGGVHWGDCSGAMSGISRFAVGLDPWGGRFATGSEAGALKSMGFTLGRGKPGDLRIGWFNGGPYGGHTAGTLPTGVHVEMGGARGNGQYGGRAAGADDKSFTDHAYLPADYFKQVEVPVTALDDPDFDVTATLDDAALSDLRDARASGATDPDTVSVDSDLPTSWSGLAGKFASDFASGFTQDTLQFFGLQDELPPFMRASQQLAKAIGYQSPMEKISLLAQRAIDAAPPGVATVMLTGAQLMGIVPKDPGRLPGGDPLRIPGFASGGLVSGAGTGTSDSILARLSNGEFVMRAAATQANRPLLEALNAQPNLLSAGTGAGAKPVEVHYHITATNVDEGMRLAEQRSRLQVSAMMGV